MSLILDWLLTPCECKSMDPSGDFEEKPRDKLGNVYSLSNGDGPIYDENHNVIGECNCGVFYDKKGNRMY